MKEKIPRYLFPKEDELPIPHYFSIELGIEPKKSKKGGTKSKRRKSKLSKFRSKIQRHTKRVR